MDPSFGTPVSVAFGRFRVLPHRGELLAGGQPIKLDGRVFDVLLAPIEARGAVIDCFGVASIPDCCCMLRSPQLPLPCTQNEAVRVVHARYQLPVQAFQVEA
jgi:hypothetical protein